MFAIIRTGGKQYKVIEGQKLQIEKIEAKPDEKIVLDDVLLVAGDDVFQLGTPKVSATVEAKVIRQLRDKKVRVYKMRRKTGYRRHQGHRQYLTEILIEKIVIGGKAVRAEEAKEAVKAVKAEKKVSEKAKV